MPDLLSATRTGMAWVRSVWSEPNGNGSSTRVNISVVIGFTLGFATALVIKIHAPISVTDFCQALNALTLFAGGICGALYGINRVVGHADNKIAAEAQQTHK